MNRFRYKPWLSPLLGSEDLLLLFFPFLPLLSFLQPSEQFWIPCFGELEGEQHKEVCPKQGNGFGGGRSVLRSFGRWAAVMSSEESQSQLSSLHFKGRALCSLWQRVTTS